MIYIYQKNNIYISGNGYIRLPPQTFQEKLIWYQLKIWYYFPTCIIITQESIIMEIDSFWLYSVFTDLDVLGSKKPKKMKIKKEWKFSEC